MYVLEYGIPWYSSKKDVWLSGYVVVNFTIQFNSMGKTIVLLYYPLVHVYSEYSSIAIVQYHL